MDYQDINNFLNTLQLSSHSDRSTVTNNSSNTQFNPMFNSRNLQFSNETIDKFNKNKQETSDKLLNRHFQLVPTEFGNKLDERNIHVQDSTKKNINMAESQLNRNSEISQIRNIPLMDYNLFSENYKNKEAINIETDSINFKMNNRDNVPSRRL